VRGAKCPLDLNAFDAVFLHYSVRLTFADFISPDFVARLQTYTGWKALFIQDEYERTEMARSWISRLGIQTVYTVVPEPYVANVYPPQRFPLVEFRSILTGYVPEHRIAREDVRPMAKRSIRIGYRGRPLHYVYGDLGQEKLRIGIDVQHLCEKRNIPSDIAWTEESRIYGDRWFAFLASCRATLGTESGANVFDEDGSLRRSIDQALIANPSLTYEQARARFLHGKEGALAKMNQISPKMFEAISLRTALILFEGEYSGILEPERHYLPLRKDYSNFDTIADKLEDVSFLESMTARAFDDIVASGRFGYSAFVASIDDDIERHVERPRNYEILSRIVAVRATSAEPWDFRQVKGLDFPAVTTLSMHAGEMAALPLPIYNDGISRAFVRQQMVRLRKIIRCLLAPLRWCLRVLPPQIRSELRRGLSKPFMTLEWG
jgi:hypothetical protein